MIRFARASLAALLALALAVLPAAAQQPPSAYAGSTEPRSIVPNYQLLQGSYAKALSTGTQAAGFTGGAILYSLRFTPTVTTNVAVIKRIMLSVGNAGTAFAAGEATFAVYAARAYTASPTGGTAATLTGNNGKLRTSFATTGMGDIRIGSTTNLTAGTATLDTDPIGGVTVGVPAVAGQAIVGSVSLFDPKNAGDYALVLANNEGFVIEATVPATGTWTATVWVEWDEYSQY
jgi:hypothetical protein